jgi:hypothetical protein
MKKIVLLMMIVVLCGCTAKEEEKQPENITQNNPLVAQSKKVDSMDVEGGFFVDWPSWCNKVRTRARTSKYTNNTAVVTAECKRSDSEGIMVFSYYELANGSTAITVDHVLQNVIAIVENQNLTIQKQRPVVRNGMEGIQLLCTGDNEKRKWIEGFFAFDRMLIITTWRSDDTLFSDPQVSKMFKSIEMLR